MKTLMVGSALSFAPQYADIFSTAFGVGIVPALLVFWLMAIYVLIKVRRKM